MARILLLIIIGLLIVAAFRGFFRAQVKPLPDAKTEGGEDMVACARCGVNLPRSEAVSEGGVYHCKDNPRCRPQ
ncbi:MAG TPA: PP0621 family protein [Usitatibacter sp.]|nr:PP0621 family protein [Usitatibacter sp.]